MKTNFIIKGNYRIRKKENKGEKNLMNYGGMVNKLMNALHYIPFVTNKHIKSISKVMGGAAINNKLI